jgi:hypothetical protein
MTVPVDAWGFERAIPHDLATEAALHEVEPPDLRLAIVANRGDHLTVQVVAGDAPLPDGWVYVKARGLFEVIRAERWPASTGGVLDRLLLVLRAYPMR